jgi:hypothetical protein
MRALLFSIAVVACSGAYMGLTTRAPQQLTLAAPLSQRTTPAVAVFSTKKHKVTRRPVRKVRLLISRPVRRGPVTTPRSILPYPALRAPTSPHTCRAARCTCGTPVAATQIKITLPFTQESFISTLIILPLNVLLFQAGFNLWSTYLASINVFDVPVQLHLCWEVALCLDPPL